MFDLENRRKELGLTLEDVGKAVGVGKSTVKKWETGFIENMKRDKIAKLAEILKVSPLEIMGIEIQQNKTDILDETTKKLVSLADSLNEFGKKKAVDYLTDLTYNPSYRKDSSDIQQDKNEEKIAKYLNKTDDSPNYSTMDIAAQHEATVTNTYTKEESDKMDEALEEIRKTFERPTKKR